MKVINIAVDKLDIFIDQLLRYLIKYEIGYVNVDNHEFHIDDTIYRLYSLDVCENSKITINKVILLQEIDFNEFLNIPFRKIIEQNNFSSSLREKEIVNHHNKNFSYISKNHIKQNNHKINQQLKSRKKQYNYNRRKMF